MSYIFQFTLSPVQSFIEQSRKTQDLFVASTILSKLTKAAIEAAKGQNLEIKFPIFDDKVNGIPNRFIARTDNADKLQLQEIGKIIEEAVLAKIIEIGDDVFRHIPKPKETPKNKKRLNALKQSYNNQLIQYFETTWAFYPIENNDYKTAYENIEHLVGAMKNTRVYTQYSANGETGRKCSLTGERNALFFGKKKPAFAAREAINLMTVPEVKIRDTEGLSAIAALKRFYRPLKKDGIKKIKFPSVANIAWQTILDKNSLLNEAAQQIKKCFTIEGLCSKLIKNAKPIQYIAKNSGFKGKAHFDFKFLYEDIIAQELTCKIFKDPQQLECLKVAYQNFKDVLNDICNNKKNKITERKYYAVICFDGDEMGKWLSGAKTPNLPPNKLEDFHAKISELLGEYSKKANTILKSPRGKTVYAGGDDFLGLVSMDSLFSVMRELRIAFEKAVNQPLRAEFKYTEPFTFSAGIAIAHHKTPLNIVLRQARQAQATAKDDADRNAFAIAALKHSGEAHYIQYKWGEIDTTKNSIENWDALETILKEISKNPATNKPNFSNTFIQNLDREFSKIFALDKENLNAGQDDEIFEKIFASEINRLVSRSNQMPANNDADKSVKQEVESKLLAALMHLSNHLIRQSYSNFIETLFILRFFSRLS